MCLLGDDLGLAWKGCCVLSGQTSLGHIWGECLHTKECTDALRQEAKPVRDAEPLALRTCMPTKATQERPGSILASEIQPAGKEKKTVPQSPTQYLVSS